VASTSAGPLELELLPARHGDSVLLTWGPPVDRHHLLIDGGPASAYAAVSARLRRVASEGSLDLLVLTHVDADHIEGALLLTNDADLNLDIAEYWFNGPAQISPKLGGAQGEMLAALISGRGIPLNAAFSRAPVWAPYDKPLPVRTLDGGLTLTVLGPDDKALKALRKAWRPTLEGEGLFFDSEADALSALRARAGLLPAKTFLGSRKPRGVSDLLQEKSTEDTAPANRSSIVLLAEYAGNTILLPGDSTPATLLAGVHRLLAERQAKRLDLTAFKLPHHGSTRNITARLLDLLPSDHYLFSSDGAKFKHPDDAGVAKCLAYGKTGSTLVFNYRNPRTLRWQHSDDLKPRKNSTLFPPAGGEGGVVVTMAARKKR
jgi:hypothetical protein